MAKKSERRKRPKYHVLLPLLLRRTAGTMDQLMKAIRARDSHQVQNCLVSVRQGGYEWSRKLGSDGIARWFAKASSKKARTPIRAKKTTAKKPTTKAKPKPKKAKANSVSKKPAPKQTKDERANNEQALAVETVG